MQKKRRQREKVTETEKLKKYMLSFGGVVGFDDDLNYQDVIHKSALATFTKQELENLDLYRDFIVQ